MSETLVAFLTEGEQSPADVNPVRWDALCKRFSLNITERLAMHGALEYALGKAMQPPTFLEIQALLAGCDQFMDARAAHPNGPLRKWRLIEVPAGVSLFAAPIRSDEWMLSYLMGAGGFGPADTDARLTALLHPVTGAETVPEPGDVLEEHSILITLIGPDADARRESVSERSRQEGRRLMRLASSAIPVSPSEIEALARLIEREAYLTRLTLLIEDDTEGTGHETERSLRSLMDQLAIPRLYLSRREPLTGALSFTRSWRSSVEEIARPTAHEQRELWRKSLGQQGAGAKIEEIIAQFDLSAPTIVSLAAEAKRRHAGLWTVCREFTRPTLDGLAQRITSRATLAHVQLPEREKKTLETLVVEAQKRSVVYDSWGFGATGTLGRGVTALFHGQSGTGKTMAAEAIADALNLDLYRIDLSQVVSKYIGETEKNLRRVFDAADSGGVVLLFDEADALFGKRSEVKDSHDRYANIEVGYLLQRMEAYRGVAVLTTNQRDALDDAFVRRLRYIVAFLFPDEGRRCLIWQGIFPDATPKEELDYAKLAKLSIPGGTIRNIALGAAFRAANNGQMITMAYLAEAARAEFIKQEHPLPEELRTW